MPTGPLDAIPMWAFFLIAVSSAIAFLEGGYRLGGWRHARIAGEKDAPVGAMVGSILALLAIMIAFTFSLAAARFEARRQVVLEEANAIGTTYLRSRILPEPQRSEIAGLLRQYVDVRIQSVRDKTIDEGIAKSEALQEQLWSAATVVAQKDTASIMTGLFLQSLNEVIDLHAKRVLTGVRSRLPLTIWLSVFGLTLLSMLSVGYQSGLSATTRSPAQLFLAVAFAGMLYLIVDLDRGHEGLLQVSQQSMLDLQRSMQPGGN